MSNSIPALFKKSLIAVAVVSLSACSTTPRNGESGLSRVGDGILTAGKATADVTGRVWNKTTYLLGFSDGDADVDARSDEGLLMDADEAALLADGLSDPRDTTIRPIVIRNAIPAQSTQEEQTPTNVEFAANEQSSFETPINRKAEQLTPIANKIRVAKPVTQTGTETEAAKETRIESVVIAEDRVHKVTSSETLWDIAKKTTGDATNWHVLADVNNLGPNASVYPGDLLIIPADMVDPSLTSSTGSETTVHQVSEQLFVDTQDLTGTTPSQVSETATQPQLEESTSEQAELSDTTESEQSGSKAFTLNPGETLWDLAKRTTGDATNWKAIAAENDFSAQQASLVRTGQTIYVPDALVASERETTSPEAEPALDTATSDKPAEIDKTLESIQTATETTQMNVEPSSATQLEALRTLTISSASSKRNSSEDLDLLNIGIEPLTKPAITQGAAKPPIKIVEAAFKSDEVAPGVTKAPDTMKNADTDAHSPEQIMVSGTYYPKAIYNNADFSSSLLMRVSPGTTLQVSKAMGNWYQVKTSKGLGYVHQRDIK